MNLKIFGRCLLACLFIVSAVYNLLFNFDGFVGAVASKGIMFPVTVAAIVLIFKLVVGLMLLFGVWTKLVIGGLIVFVVAATAMYHNAFVDRKQLNDMLKNIAIVGGLMLLYN
jgi:putative oxidoreductase